MKFLSYTLFSDTASTFSLVVLLGDCRLLDTSLSSLTTSGVLCHISDAAVTCFTLQWTGLLLVHKLQHDMNGAFEDFSFIIFSKFPVANRNMSACS